MGSAGGLDPWQLLGAGLVGLWLGGVLALTRLPATPLSRAVRGLVVCAALWAGGDLIAGLASDLFWKQIGVSILYSGVDLPARRLVDRGPALGRGPRGAPPFHSRRWVRAPLVFASAMWLAMVTNPWHGQFLVPVIGQRNLYGPLWWLMALPNYALILGAGAVVLRALRGTARPARAQPGRLPDRRERHHPGGQLGLRVGGGAPCRCHAPADLGSRPDPGGAACCGRASSASCRWRSG